MSLDNLDTYRTIDLELDLANDYIEPVTLSAGDNEGRVIRVSLYNGTATVDGSSYTARLLYNPQPQNPNSAGGYVTMTAVDSAPTATWTVSVPGSSLIPGVALMAIRVSEGDNVICTRTFDAIVESGVIHEGASETTSALSEFWEAVENIQQEIDAFAKELQVTASVDGTKWTETTPSVTVTQTTSEDKVDVDLKFSGIVGGEGFAWNILRGTNEYHDIVTDRANTSWTRGEWGWNVSGGTYECFDVSDAPVADIAYGWRCISSNNNTCLIAQIDIPLIVGETYVISAYARGGTMRIFYSSADTSIFNATTGDEWQQYYATFVANEESGRISIGAAAGNTLELCGMKLELAADPDNPRPTAWTPSPWDLTPQLSMTASSDATSSDTPTVTVTQETSGNATAFDLAFSGLRGADGQGVPSGGSAGALLAKASESDYDTEWTNVIGRDLTVSNGSGNFTVQENSWAQSQTPLDSQYYTPTFRLYDADGVRIGYVCGRYYNSSDRLGISYYATRTISGTEYSFGFTPNIDASGNLMLMFANTASMQAWQSALGINTLQATVAALADTTATLAAAHDADADAICALYVDLIHHDVRDIDSVPDAYRAQVTAQLELDGDDWSDPYVDDLPTAEEGGTPVPMPEA